MQTESKITNETLRKQTESKMHLEIGCLNLLKERANSPFTVESVFKFMSDSRFELAQELASLDKELIKHLRYLRPQAEADIRARYDEDYFRNIEKCFADIPKGLQPSDVEMKGGVLSYTEAYRTARLATATIEPTDVETELYTAINEARSAVEKLRDLGVGRHGSGDLQWVLFDANTTEEIAYHYIQAERRRAKFINL